jgi:MoaA/NifB/PqqE/SkfB family radical SAM enzyme
VTLSTVVTRINHEHVLEVGEFLRAYQEQNGNVHAWHIYRFVPEGRGGRENAQALAVPLDRYEEIFAQARARHLPFKVFKRANMFQSKTVNFY